MLPPRQQLTILGVILVLGLLCFSYFRDRASPVVPDVASAPTVDVENEPHHPDVEPLRQVIQQAEPEYKVPATAKEDSVEDLLPDLGLQDSKRITEMQMRATTREEWAVLDIDSLFAPVFDMARKGSTTVPLQIDDEVNPEGIKLTSEESEQLEALLQPLNREVDRANAFYLVESYHAYRELAATGPVVTLPEFDPSAVYPNKPDRTTKSKLQPTTASRKQMLEKLAADAGGIANFKHAVSTDFPTPEEWSTYYKTGVFPRMRSRVLALTRAQHPSVFAADDRLQELVQQRREQARSFISSLRR